MKTLFVLASLFLVLVIGLSYDSLVYGDHPDPVELTFNQDSYEYGDTMIVTAKLPEPFTSSGRTTLAVLMFKDQPAFEMFDKSINSTGYAVFEIPLTSKDLQSGSFTVTGFSAMFTPNGIKTHETYKWHNITLNSDQKSTIIDNMKTLKILNNTVTTDNKKLSFLDSSITIIDNALITFSQLFHEEQKEIDALQTSTSTISEEIKSLKQEIKTLKKQVNSHANNGTKHHSHP